MKSNINSGSIKDWTHSPNLTPAGYEIKRDELYVLPGDTIIKIYHLLINQRVSSLLTLSKVPPTELETYEEYLSLSKYINNVLHDVLMSMPLTLVLQMQDESRAKKEMSKKNETTDAGLTLKELFDKFHLSVGDRDERNRPPKKNGDVKGNNDK